MYCGYVMVYFIQANSSSHLCAVKVHHCYSYGIIIVV